MLIELDYGYELGKKIGFEQIRDFYERGVNVRPKKARRNKSKERREYETQGQDIGMRRAYAEKKRGYIVHLVVTLAITLLLFLYERVDLMAKLAPGGIVDGTLYPVSYTLIGMQVLLLDAALSFRRLWEGITRLFDFTLTDASFCSLLVLATFAYHLFLLFAPSEGAPTLYLSPAAGSLVVLAVADLLDWYRESTAFQVISSRRQKYALTDLISVGGKRDSAEEHLRTAQNDEKLKYVCPVGFVRNYMANTNKRVKHDRSFGSRMLIVAAFGLAFGIYVYARGFGITESVRMAFLAFLLCLPATSVLVTSVPMFFAARLRLGKKGAIVGEGPIYGEGEVTALVMPDTEIFEPMSHEQFELIDDSDADKKQTLALIRGLLEKVQSPLVDSVAVNPVDRIDAREITLEEIGDEGVGAVCGEHKMLFGSVAYLEKYGMTVAPREEGKYEDLYRRLLCVAIDGRPVALFLARYRLTAEAAHLVGALAEEDVRVMVRSKDPGVTDELFRTLQPDSAAPMRVMRPTAEELDIRNERVDSTVVAIGSCCDAARVFVACRRVRHATTLGRVLQVLSLVVGAAVAGLVTVFSPAPAVSAFAVTMYALLWCGLHTVSSYFCLRNKEHL